MKALMYAIFLLAVALFSTACDENDVTDLVQDVALGKMIVVINDGNEEMLDCSFIHYGGNSEWTGEVFINASKVASDAETTMNFMYGNYSNDVAFSARTYLSTDELMNVSTTYGSPDDNAVISMTVTELKTTGIKGYFSGKLATKQGLIDVKGAFWALPATVN